MAVLAIDPSFTRTGIYIFPVSLTKVVEVEQLWNTVKESWWDTFRGNQKEGYFISTFSEIEEASFPFLYKASLKLATIIGNLLTIFNEVDTVILEYPPPTSQYSAGLYMLDGLIMNIARDPVFKIKKVWMVPPNTINSYLKRKEGLVFKPSKTEIVNYVKKSFTVKRLNHDEASAYILKEIIDGVKTGELKYTVYMMDEFNLKKCKP